MHLSGNWIAEAPPFRFHIQPTHPFNRSAVGSQGGVGELEAEGVQVYYARVKRHLERFFNPKYAKSRRKKAKKYRFQTLNPAIRAFMKYQKAKNVETPELDALVIEEMLETEKVAQKRSESTSTTLTDS